MMKYAVAISCILFFAIAIPFVISDGTGVSKQQRIINGIWRAECRCEIGASLADEAAIRAGKFAQATRKQKCYIGCMMTKAGFFDKNGNKQLEFVNKTMERIFGVKLATIVDGACNPLQGKDVCETATLVYQCHYNFKIASLI